MSDPNIIEIKNEETTIAATSGGSAPATHENYSQTGRMSHSKHEEPLVTQELLRKSESFMNNIKQESFSNRQLLSEKDKLGNHQPVTRLEPLIEEESEDEQESIIRQEILGDQKPLSNQSLFLNLQIRQDLIIREKAGVEQEPSIREKSEVEQQPLIREETLNEQEASTINESTIVTNEEEQLPPHRSRAHTLGSVARVRHEIHIMLNRGQSLNQIPVVNKNIEFENKQNTKENISVEEEPNTTKNTKENISVEEEPNTTKNVTLKEESNRAENLGNLEKDTSNHEHFQDDEQNSAYTTAFFDTHHDSLVPQESKLQFGSLRSLHRSNKQLVKPIPVIVEEPLKIQISIQRFSTALQSQEHLFDIHEPLASREKAPINDPNDTFYNDETYIEDEELIKNTPLIDPSQIADPKSLVDEPIAGQELAEGEGILVRRDPAVDKSNRVSINEGPDTTKNEGGNQELFANQNELMAVIPYEKESINFFTPQQTSSLIEETKQLSNVSVISCGGTTTRNIPYPSNYRCLAATAAPYSIIHKESKADMPGPSARPPMRCTCGHKTNNFGAYGHGALSLPNQGMSTSTCHSRNRSSTDDIIDYPRQPPCPQPLYSLLSSNQRCPHHNSSTMSHCGQPKPKCKAAPQCNRRKKTPCDEEYFSLSSDSSDGDDCGPAVYKQPKLPTNAACQPCSSTMTNYKPCSSASTTYHPCVSTMTAYQPCASNSAGYQAYPSNNNTTATVRSVPPCTEPSFPPQQQQQQGQCSSAAASDKGSTCQGRNAAIVQLLRELVQLVEGEQSENTTCEMPCDAPCVTEVSEAAMSAGRICNITEMDNSAFNCDIPFASTPVCSQTHLPEPPQCLPPIMPCNVFISPNTLNSPFVLMPVNQQPGMYELMKTPEVRTESPWPPGGETISYTTPGVESIHYTMQQSAAQSGTRTNEIVCEPDFIDDANTCPPPPPPTLSHTTDSQAQPQQQQPQAPAPGEGVRISMACTCPTTGPGQCPLHGNTNNNNSNSQPMNITINESLPNDEIPMAWAPIPGNINTTPRNENTGNSATTYSEEDSDVVCDEQEEECMQAQFNRRAARQRNRGTDNGNACDCCHCRAMRNKMGCCGGNNPPGMDADPNNVLKFFVDSIIMDLEAMEHARHKKQFEQSVCKPASCPRQSFPVTITEVTDLGTSSLYVKWCIHDCFGIGGYEIYVDGYLTNRYFHSNHEAAVVCEIDVTKPHKIVLMAVPRIDDDELSADKMSNICKTLMRPSDVTKQSHNSNNNSMPSNNICPKAPSHLWVPSIYLYDPSCRLVSAPISRMN